MTSRSRRYVIDFDERPGGRTEVFLDISETGSGTFQGKYTKISWRYSGESALSKVEESGTIRASSRREVIKQFLIFRRGRYFTDLNDTQFEEKLQGILTEFDQGGDPETFLRLKETYKYKKSMELEREISRLENEISKHEREILNHQEEIQKLKKELQTV